MSNNKPVILCLDDDPDILTFLQIILEAEGYTFAGADSAEEGLRVYKEIDPDLVIVDLMMEEVDAGTGFVKEIQASGQHRPGLHAELGRRQPQHDHGLHRSRFGGGLSEAVDQGVPVDGTENKAGGDRAGLAASVEVATLKRNQESAEPGW